MDDLQATPDRPQPRRLTEFAIALPFIGAILVGIPLLWNTDADQGQQVATSNAGVYLFSVWFGMIVLAVILAWAFSRQNRKT